MAPIILLGSGGMLHRAWLELLERRKLSNFSPSLDQLDLTRPASIDSTLESAKLVINCAGYTDVDRAEAESELAMAVNGAGAGALADACRRHGATLVHYSTDYVFSGEGERNWRVDDPRRPVNAYGRSKARGEELVERSGCDALIIRTSWMYAPWGKNFVRTIAAGVRQKRALRVVNDQSGRPTSAEHLAAHTLALLEHNARGVWHVCDGGQCTWFELARHIGRQLDPSVPIEPCTSAELTRPARRPANSVLDLSLTEALLGSMPPWENSVNDVLRRSE